MSATIPARTVTDNQVPAPAAPPGTSLRTWRRAPRVVLMAAAVLSLACLLLTVSTSAFANSYSLGNWLCEDFEDAEQSHQSEPDNVLLQRYYAHCLITRGM